MTACPLGKPPLIATASSPALVRLALVHLLDLDDVGVAEVLLLADHVRLADARQEGDGLVVLGEGGGRVVEDRVVVVLLAVAGGVPAKDKDVAFCCAGGMLDVGAQESEPGRCHCHSTRT